MKRRSLTLLLAAPFLVGWVLWSGARVTVFEVQREGNDLVVIWQSELEDGVREYELRRQTPYSDGGYVLIKAVQAHGVGKQYRYRDDQVYKNTADMIAYRLDVVYQDGSREVGVKDFSINYTPTAVRRTWGSIKAMFQ